MSPNVQHDASSSQGHARFADDETGSLTPRIKSDRVDFISQPSVPDTDAGNQGHAMSGLDRAGDAQSLNNSGSIMTQPNSTE